ncbi:hypothetical protein GCM10009560_35010 [Nonomuraea longicatena]|uniref:Transposase n=1 Tax=Nonomuraea longicatena TaxID=83682 RepID=A0ABP4A425_9ACTN
MARFSSKRHGQPPQRSPARSAKTPRPRHVQAALMPGVTRSGRTVAFDAETMAAAYGMLQVIVALTKNRP